MDDTSAFHLLVAMTVSLVIVPTNGEFTRVRLIAVSLPTGSMVTAGVAATIRTGPGAAVLLPVIARTQLKPASALVALHTCPSGGPNHTMLQLVTHTIGDRELTAILFVMTASTFGTLNMLARSLSPIALCPLIGSTVTAAVAAMTRTRTGVAVLEPVIARPQFKPAFAQAALHTGRFGTPNLTMVTVTQDREMKPIISVMALSTSGMLNMPARKIENDVASGDETVFVDGITLTEA